MSETALIWLVVASIVLHNSEEVIWFPAWSNAHAGRGRRLVRPLSLRFALSVLTGLAIGIGVHAQQGGYGSLGHYLLGAYALGQSINVFWPHLLASVLTRSYVPGLATGVFFVLPTSAAYLGELFTGSDFDARRFIHISFIFLPLLLLSIPLLLWLGDRMGGEK